MFKLINRYRFGILKKKKKEVILKISFQFIYKDIIIM